MQQLYVHKLYLKSNLFQENLVKQCLVVHVLQTEHINNDNPVKPETVNNNLTINNVTTVVQNIKQP